MQDTNGSGKETYCAESMEEMLYSYVNTYIYIYIYTHILIYIYIYDYICIPINIEENMHFEKLLKGTLFRWVVPPNVHVQPQFLRTPSAPPYLSFRFKRKAN